jgi:hypothetical protein
LLGGEAAQRGVMHARDRLRLAEDERALGLLGEHAGTLADLLLQTCKRLTEIEGRLQRTGTWAPAAELRHSLRRLAGASGDWS